jgi:hypothetical protein
MSRRMDAVVHSMEVKLVQVRATVTAAPSIGKSGFAGLTKQI